MSQPPFYNVARAVPVTDKFAHDKFMLNQKVMSLGNKYYIYNEANQPLFFVERPLAFNFKCQFSIWNDDTKTHKLLSLTQDRFAFMSYEFTLADENGQTIGYFKRNGWLSMLRRTWKVYNAQNQEIAEAHEDSWWKAIVRRVSDLGAFLRTNFEIIRSDGAPVGMFIRKFTLTDKYVLDLTSDPQLTFDRRIGVGLAVLLDNLERR